MMPERNCSTCTKQEEWGCSAKKVRETKENEDPRDSWTNPAHLPLRFDEEEYYGCPRRSIFESSSYWEVLMTYYSAYKVGALPDAGGVVDQCYATMQALQLIEGAVEECKAEKSNQSSRRKGRP